MPTSGECSGCLRAPIPRYRFNVVIEDRVSRKLLSQLMCGECMTRLVRRLLDKSVEITPQGELDDLQVTTITQPLHNGVTGVVA